MLNLIRNTCSTQNSVSVDYEVVCTHDTVTFNPSNVNEDWSKDEQQSYIIGNADSDNGKNLSILLI